LLAAYDYANFFHFSMSKLRLLLDEAQIPSDSDESSISFEALSAEGDL
jgi:hypothetical protein